MAAVSHVLIIGGGVIGLAIALELRLRGAAVTVLTRDFAEAASQAAAGMLAPQAEMIPPGAMREFCLRSRSLYPGWTQKLETLTGLPTGYWACGILAPVYEKESAVSGQPSTVNRQPSAEAQGEDGIRGAERVKEQGELKTQNSKLSLPPTPSLWLDRAAIHQHQPGLSQDVSGGWWYPDDAQVDNRLLAKALWVAAYDAGVDLQEGVAVATMLHQSDRITGVQTSSGTMQSEQYVLATGAWSQALLPIPVTPRKGQMLSVRVPAGQELPLKTVLFGSEIYIVPRRDGRIVIGATSEDVGFTPNNTPEGVQALLERAIRLYPALRDFPLQEFWWGFRPATPDELPLLGDSPYGNLTLATGHYRNGILLAPVTAQLIADRLQQQSDELLDAFHWSRFRTAP
ncbi:glycine oxidase ThiO [Stenomitos frigidus]|uniref:glycine oxidase n=1 Tax=Stenomitos frigidus ULC18 TaxID=2107698 RepID=A0A2T1ENY3_9CYAN|nr:glycine oxidase ThiO [Stenomitos frigidus]PSB34444.1 glycine oxidase ThiO [Stenomitos frigidus ULC18]